MKSIALLLSLVAISAAAPGAAPGKPAPAFTLPDAAGKTVSLSDFAERTVVLEWINFDCPFVRKHYGSGNMQALQKEALGKEVVWLSIASSAKGKQGFFEGEALQKRITDETWAGSHYLVDADGKVGKAWGARTTPHMFVVAPDGKVAYAGAIDDKASTDAADIAGSKNHVRSALEALAAGKPVAPAATSSYGCSVKY